MEIWGWKPSLVPVPAQYQGKLGEVYYPVTCSCSSTNTKFDLGTVTAAACADFPSAFALTSFARTRRLAARAPARPPEELPSRRGALCVRRFPRGFSLFLPCGRGLEDE